jgi:hypothetical protein
LESFFFALVLAFFLAPKLLLLLLLELLVLELLLLKMNRMQTLQASIYLLEY